MDFQFSALKIAQLGDSPALTAVLFAEGFNNILYI